MATASHCIHIPQPGRLLDTGFALICKMCSNDVCVEMRSRRSFKSHVVIIDWPTLHEGDGGGLAAALPAHLPNASNDKSATPTCSGSHHRLVAVYLETQAPMQLCSTRSSPTKLARVRLTGASAAVRQTRVRNAKCSFHNRLI
jgi:hypothetical protein